MRDEDPSLRRDTHLLEIHHTDDVHKKWRNTHCLIDWKGHKFGLLDVLQAPCCWLTSDNHFARMCSKSTIIIAGALFVSPLAAAAFSSRSPPSSFASSATTATSSSASILPLRLQPSVVLAGDSKINASLLSADSLDADEQQTILESKLNNHVNDILSRAVMENSKANGAVVNGSNGAVNGIKGVEIAANGYINGQVLQQERKKQLQRQQKQLKDKARRNNKAMADPDFLRKRTQTLLRKTDGLCNNTGGEGSDNNNLSLGGGTLKVDKRTFDWLIDAWAYSGESDAADNALTLLSRMEQLRDSNIALSHDSVVSPDVKSYTKVANAIARSGWADAGEQAEHLLNRMINDDVNDLHPNTYTYTYVIDAYARSSSTKAPHAAQRLIDHMELLRSQGDPDVRPTTRAWNSVIAAWAGWKGEEMVRRPCCMHLI